MRTAFRYFSFSAALLLCTCIASLGAEFSVSTAQELQNALTTAAANGVDDSILVDAGYYTGNFNFSSAESQALTLRAADGVEATAVTLDGNGAGRALGITCSVIADINVQNLTFMRDTGSVDFSGLRVETFGGVEISG
ncbi:MAG: hypothetical protein DRP64_04365, partial [Verrucomicrobia bacterium]